MPTLQADFAVFLTEILGRPVTISLEDNFMFPTGETQTAANVTQGGFSGTQTFKQGFINTAFVDATIPIDPSRGGSVFVGAGVAVDQTTVSAVFTAATDFFRSTNIDLLVAVQAGALVTLPLPGSPQLEVKAVDFLPGRDHRFGINGLSEAHYKIENVLGGTAKLIWQFSDMRLKRDIVRVSHLDNGLGLYRYRYLWSDQVYVGVMAQEVAAVRPDAVMRGTDGWLRVNYARLGMKLQTWDEWQASPRAQRTN